jgi:hypothetical protein
MFIGHYAALPPVRYDPHWPHSHAITASIRLALSLALTHTRQHPLLATCLDYLHSHTRTMRPSTPSPIYLYAYFQRILGVATSPLAPRPHTLAEAGYKEGDRFHLLKHVPRSSPNALPALDRWGPEWA